MHCINYAKREQEKPLLFKLTDYGHISHYHKLMQSLLSQTILYIYILVVFGLSTLNSNLTNHKLQCKKIKLIKNANICPCNPEGFKHDIGHLNMQTLYIEAGLERLRHRQV